MNIRNLIIALSALLSPIATAQSFSIDWYKVAGGGGASTGGVFTVSGTIGQHDAGQQLAGGGFSLTGGFSALYALQTPGSPFLTISLTPTNTVVVSWPSSSAGFMLQQSVDAASANWSNFSGSVTDDGTTQSVIVPIQPGTLFFRLRK